MQCILLMYFLAPLAKRQRSFSDVESSSVVVVVVNVSPKLLISPKLFDNFLSSLAYSFIRKAPMYCINEDLVESS